MTDPRIRATVSNVVELLVRHEYAELEALTAGCRLDRHAIASSIASYGRTLVSVPDEAYDRLDIVRVRSEQPQWSVRLHLWTEEEGESDLSLELTIIDKEGNLALELDDLHVL